MVIAQRPWLPLGFTLGVVHGCQGWWGGGMSRGVNRRFLGQWVYSVVTDTHHCTPVHTAHHPTRLLKARPAALRWEEVPGRVWRWGGQASPGSQGRWDDSPVAAQCAPTSAGAAQKQRLRWDLRATVCPGVVVTGRRSVSLGFPAHPSAWAAGVRMPGCGDCEQPPANAFPFLCSWGVSPQGFGALPP